MWMTNPQSTSTTLLESQREEALLLQTKHLLPNHRRIGDTLSRMAMDHSNQVVNRVLQTQDRVLTRKLEAMLPTTMFEQATLMS